MLLSGLCDTPTPRALRMPISGSVTQTACAASTPAPRNPSASRYITGDGLDRSCAVLSSACVSARWISVGTVYLRARARDAINYGPAGGGTGGGAAPGAVT